MSENKTTPVRPKDVARVYMHRFKHYIPDLTRYQRAARNALGKDSAGAGYYGPYVALSAQIYAQHCLTLTEMRAFDFLEFHAMYYANPSVCLVKRGEITILEELQESPNWEHATLMKRTVLALPGALVGAYCFDTFAIDNSRGENGNVLWAKYQFNAKWGVLTDLAALST